MDELFERERERERGDPSRLYFAEYSWFIWSLLVWSYTGVDTRSLLAL